MLVNETSKISPINKLSFDIDRMYLELHKIIIAVIIFKTVTSHLRGKKYIVRVII